jgi:hypothetical protein
MKDYGESYVNLCQAERSLYAALIGKEWGRAIDMIDDIVVAAREMRAFCMNEEQRDTGRQSQKEGS